MNEYAGLAPLRIANCTYFLCICFFTRNNYFSVPSSRTVMDFPPHTFAAQWTFYECRLFQRIKLNEIVYWLTVIASFHSFLFSYEFVKGNHTGRAIRVSGTSTLQICSIWSLSSIAWVHGSRQKLFSRPTWRSDGRCSPEWSCWLSIATPSCAALLRIASSTTVSLVISWFNTLF